jgi:hypothetical protein
VTSPLTFLCICKVKVRVQPIIGHEDPGVEYRYSSPLSFTSALDEVGGKRHAPANVPPGKTLYPLYRRLGRPRAGLDGAEYLVPQWDSIPRPSSPSESLHRLRYPGPPLHTFI